MVFLTDGERPVAAVVQKRPFWSIIKHFLPNEPATYFVLPDELRIFVRGVNGPKIHADRANGARS